MQWGENLKIIGGHIKTGAATATVKAKTNFQKAKEKEVTQKMGARLSMMFKKNKNQNGVVEAPLVDDVANDDPVMESTNPNDQ